MTGSHFGEFLIREGRLRPEGLKKALEMQAMIGGRLGTNLLELGLITEEALLAALGRHRRTRIVSGPDLQDIPPAVIRLVSPKLARRHHIVPYQLKGRSLLIAAMDPGDALVEDELGLLTSCLARTVIALELRIHDALERCYRIKQPVRFGALARRLARQSAGSVVSVTEAPAVASPAGDAPPSATPCSESLRPRPRAAPRESAPPADLARPPARTEAGSVAPAPAVPVGAKKAGTAESVPTTPQYIELDDEDLALLHSTADSGPRTAEERLDAAADHLQRIDIRDEIGDVLLAFCAPYFQRRLLLVRRKEQIIGWRGEGEGVDRASVRAIEIPISEPSVFLGLTESTSFWLGPLPTLPANQPLVRGLGGSPPKECVVLPVLLRSRVVCFLYGDNGEVGVTGTPMAALRRLVSKAGVAYEVYILKNKIRTL
ncbi:MAG: hypothetical protein GY856_21540 [bacterium]|nr:hypothetical protein [bacterium]